MQQFCVRWNSYQSNLQNVFPKLLNNEHFVDVTLACEAQMIKCHKVVLSACSTYFEQLLVQNPCQHPIIFMKDMKHWEVQALVDFMYKGEVNVSQEEIPTLLKAAEALQIRGLCGADRQQDSNAVSLPPETTLSDSGGRESPPAKRRKYPEQQQDRERTERREKQQSSAPTPKQTNTSSGPSVTSTPTSSSNDLSAAAGVSGSIAASVTSAPFRDNECNNSAKETHSEDVSDRSNIKREHVDQDDSYFDNDGDYESFDIQDDSNSMNPDISMPTSPLDQAGPSGVPGMQDTKPTAAWQHLEYLLGSTARRGRPKRDDPSLKAAAHLVMDRSYTLRQAALQFQIPPTTLRNYMKRSGMLRLPLKRGRPISSASSYHFYSEPFRMPGNFMNPAYPRANAPQYPMHQQQQYPQQYQHQQHSQQSQHHQQHQQAQHHQPQIQQHQQQQPHAPQHHHIQQSAHIQQQQQYQHHNPQTQTQSQSQSQAQPQPSQHISQQSHSVAQQQQFGFNNDFGSGFGDFGNEYCDIQELRTPKLETSRTPPVEIDLDSEPDQEAVRGLGTVDKSQSRTLPSTEVERGNEDQDEEVDDEEEEEEEEEEEDGGVSGVAGSVKPGNESVAATTAQGDDESDSESDSEESEADEERT